MKVKIFDLKSVAAVFLSVYKTKQQNILDNINKMVWLISLIINKLYVFEPADDEGQVHLFDAKQWKNSNSLLLSTSGFI